ncbi:hypothetical protein CR513_26528, partial [Mucuna pruriens]
MQVTNSHRGARTRLEEVRVHLLEMDPRFDQEDACPCPEVDLREIQIKIGASLESQIEGALVRVLSENWDAFACPQPTCPASIRISCAIVYPYPQESIPSVKRKGGWERRRRERSKPRQLGYCRQDSSEKSSTLAGFPM